MESVSLNVLVIDDEMAHRENICELVKNLGHTPTMVASGISALSMSPDKLRRFDMAIIDQSMPQKDGFQTAKELLAVNSRLLPIMLTGFADLEHMRKAYHSSFADYLAKPIMPATIKECFQSPKVQKLIRFKKFLQEDCLKISERYNFFGKSEATKKLKERIEKAAEYDDHVLIIGDSGTGKEMVASLIHHKSSRKNKAFSPLNCGSIPKGMEASELFGHKKGAFTDAIDDHAGIFENAKGGTVFLDEIGEMPLDQQVALLRVLQEKAVKRCGENEERSVDFRLIAATNKNLEKGVKEKNFREDLFYRLNVLRIEVPSLRERMDDFPGLIEFFVQQIDPEDNLEIPDEVMEKFYKYQWPGNIRELENFIRRGCCYEDWDGVLAEIDKSSSQSSSDLVSMSSGKGLFKDIECFKEAMEEIGGDPKNISKENLAKIYGFVHPEYKGKQRDVLVRGKQVHEIANNRLYIKSAYNGELSEYEILEKDEDAQGDLKKTKYKIKADYFTVPLRGQNFQSWFKSKGEDYLKIIFSHRDEFDVLLKIPVFRKLYDQKRDVLKLAELL